MERKFEEGKWKDLNTDCLVQIFAKVDTKTLAQSILLVCKSWSHATNDPRCWKTLVFSEPRWFSPSPCYPFPGRFRSNNFIKFVVGRCQGLATSVELPVRFFCAYISFETLTHICECCPNLKVLDMSQLWDREFKSLNFGDIFSKLKKLEFVKLGCGQKPIINLLAPISAHCKNLVGLDLYDYQFGGEDVSAIIQFTPKIKYLKINPSTMLRYDLRMILSNLIELEELDVCCYSFYPDKDDEILKLSSRIKFFKFSVLEATPF